METYIKQVVGVNVKQYVQEIISQFKIDYHKFVMGQV